MNAIRVILALAAGMLLAACATVKVPLCPEIAEMSYPVDQGEPGERLNHFLARFVEKRKVRVERLSWFVAEAKGLKWHVADLQANIAELTCAFDPGQMSYETRATYLSCMTHAPEWLGHVQGERPQDLMLAETLFYENCALSGR
jgi:hypothetical protein